VSGLRSFSVQNSLHRHSLNITEITLRGTFDVVMRKTPSNESFTLNVRAKLETYSGWGVSVSDDPDPVFSFTAPAAIETSTGSNGDKSWETTRTQHDVFGVRDALFRVDDVAEALAFFRTYGPLRLDKLLGHQAGTVKLSQVRFLRDIREKFLLQRSTTEDFQRAGLKEDALSSLATIFDIEANISPLVSLIREREIVVGIIRCKDINDASQAAVYLDRLSGYGWNTCKECEKLYKRLSKHKRKYCSPQCLSYSTTQAKLNPGESPAERRKRIRRKKT
jgi:hypothetical protein